MLLWRRLLPEFWEGKSLRLFSGGAYTTGQIGRELPSELAPWTLLDEKVRLEHRSAMSDERDELALEAIQAALGVAILVSAQAAV
jgi:hypothetical protein